MKNLLETKSGNKVRPVPILCAIKDCKRKAETIAYVSEDVDGGNPYAINVCEHHFKILEKNKE